MDIEKVVNVKIKKLSKYAKMPTYGTSGSVCFDLYAIEDVTLRPNKVYGLRTGLVFEVPDGYVMRIYSRSGLAFKHGVVLVNGVGIIDSDYRGEVKIGLLNLGEKNIVIKRGDRVAQAEIEKTIRTSFEFVEKISNTVRGANGFGSTGK